MKKVFRDQGLRINIIITDRLKPLLTRTHYACSFSCWLHLPKYQNLAAGGGRQIFAEMKASASYGIFFSREFCFSWPLYYLFSSWLHLGTASVRFCLRRTQLTQLVCGDRRGNSASGCVRLRRRRCFDWKGTRRTWMYTYVFLCTCPFDATSQLKKKNTALIHPLVRLSVVQAGDLVKIQ